MKFCCTTLSYTLLLKHYYPKYSTRTNEWNTKVVVSNALSLRSALYNIVRLCVYFVTKQIGHQIIISTYAVIVDAQFLEGVDGNQNVSHICVDLLLLVSLPQLRDDHILREKKLRDNIRTKSWCSSFNIRIVLRVLAIQKCLMGIEGKLYICVRKFPNAHFFLQNYAHFIQAQFKRISIICHHVPMMQLDYFKILGEGGGGAPTSV